MHCLVHCSAALECPTACPEALGPSRVAPSTQASPSIAVVSGKRSRLLAGPRSLFSSLGRHCMLHAPGVCCRYPHHTEVQAFLELFSEEFGVRNLVQFNTRVVEVRPLSGGSPHKATVQPPEQSRDERLKRGSSTVGSWRWQGAAAGGVRGCKRPACLTGPLHGAIRGAAHTHVVLLKRVTCRATLQCCRLPQ